MQPWITWAIVIGIGIVVGFIVHALIRFAQGSSVLTTLLAGVIGAAAAAWFVAPYWTSALGTTSVVAGRFIWSAIGALVLSAIVETLFAGSRRGHVITVRSRAGEVR